MLGMLVLAGPDDIAALGFFTFCIVLLFVGFGGLLYSIYSSGLEDAAPADAPYACKHCGRRFTKKKSHEVHERTCVEMRI